MGIEKEVQSHYLQSVESQHIPSGAIIPDRLLRSFLPEGASILDFGGGVGDKAKHLEEFGYHVTLFDLNPHAVTTATQRGIHAIEVDVSHKNDVQRAVREHALHPDAVIMEALLCNMVEPNRKDTFPQGLNSAASVLPKGGKLFIAEMLAIDEYNPFLQRSLLDWELVKLQELWNIRYGNNVRIGMPNHVFIVAKPGWWKELMEYGSPADLWELFQRKEVERYARHFTDMELDAGLSNAGFRQLSLEYTIWKSRSGRPLSGCVIVGEKE
jgi:SAM-dependent methyltransferase